MPCRAGGCACAFAARHFANPAHSTVGGLCACGHHVGEHSEDVASASAEQGRMLAASSDAYNMNDFFDLNLSAGSRGVSPVRSVPLSPLPARYEMVLAPCGEELAVVRIEGRGRRRCRAILLLPFAVFVLLGIYFAVFGVHAPRPRY